MVRLEGVGPITAEAAREFLTGCAVTLTPVLDTGNQPAVHSYEVPAAMATALHLRNPASAYPWSSATHRHTDLDHTIPYQQARSASTARSASRARSASSARRAGTGSHPTPAHHPRPTWATSAS